MGLVSKAGIGWMVALGVAACGGNGPAATGTPTTPPVTDRPVATAAPSYPPPVPTAYAVASRHAQRIGRAAIELVLARDSDRLHARFGKRLATAVPKRDLSRLLRKLAQLLERATLIEEDAIATIYSAQYESGRKRLTVTVSIDKFSRISGLQFKRVRKLPADPKAKHVAKTRFRLPFDGTWWMFWGGDTERQNYHVVVPDQRHAYDIVIWRNGATHRGDGTRNEDYWAFGKPILAPAAGEIVIAVDGIKDNKPKLERNRQQIAGNHVLLKVADAEYLLLGHFKQGSVRVKTGDRVKLGQVLGLCGNSGNSTEPHLHIHLQNSATVFKSVGLPLAFDSYAADGKHLKSGRPVQGEFVTSMPR